MKPPREDLKVETRTQNAAPGLSRGNRLKASTGL